MRLLALSLQVHNLGGLISPPTGPPSSRWCALHLSLALG